MAVHDLHAVKVQDHNAASTVPTAWDRTVWVRPAADPPDDRQVAGVVEQVHPTPDRVRISAKMVSMSCSNQSTGPPLGVPSGATGNMVRCSGTTAVTSSPPMLSTQASAPISAGSRPIDDVFVLGVQHQVGHAAACRRIRRRHSAVGAVPGACVSMEPPPSVSSRRITSRESAVDLVLWPSAVRHRAKLVPAGGV